MSVSTAQSANRATLRDLQRYDGKAELIAGTIIPLMPTGHRPSQVAGEIYVALREWVRSLNRGFAYTDNMGFAVPELASGRESFSPDVAYFEGNPPADEMDFVPRRPNIRRGSPEQRQPRCKAEAELAAKRRDYFEAGTNVAWDVDTEAGCIRKYTHDAPEQPTVFANGSTADAEPALPGWRVPVDRLLA